MGIKNVTLDWTQETCEGSADPSNGQYSGSIVEVYVVDFEGTETNPRFRKYAALTARGRDVKGNYYEIPDWFAPHEFITPKDGALFVSNKTVRPDDPLSYRVAVTYTFFPNPVAQPALISYSFATEAGDFEQAFDANGNPVAVANSSNEPFDPPLTRDYHDLIISVQQAYSNFDRVQTGAYVDAVNSDSFLAFEPGKVRCKGIKADRVRGAGVYWMVNMEFHVRTAKSDVLNVGWLRRVIDQGYREKAYIGGKNVYREIVDTDGKRISQPVWLDGSGHKLPADATQPHFLTFRDYDLLPFTSFFNIRL